MKTIGKHVHVEEDNEASDDMHRMAKIIGPMICGQAREIFESHALKFLNEPPMSVITAVWGTSPDGELTSWQRRISEEIPPIVKRVIDTLQFKQLSREQQFAIDYLVRGNIIVHVCLMVEVLRSESLSGNGSAAVNKNDLIYLEPAGSA